MTRKSEIHTDNEPMSSSSAIAADLSEKGQVAELLIKGAYVPVVAAAVVAALMVWALRDTVPMRDLAVWSFLLFVVYFVRLVLFHKPKSYTHILGI